MSISIKYFWLVVGIILIALLFIYKNLNKNSDNISLVSIWPDDSIENFNDKVFLSDVSNITFNKDLFFISSFSNSKIYLLDTTLKYMGEFGYKGKGPSEFTSITTFCFLKDILIIYDNGKQAFLLYHWGGDNKFKYLKEVKNEIPELIFDRICSDNSKLIYIETPTNEYPISVIDTSFSELFSFGEKLNFESFAEKRARNFSHLFFDRNNNLLIRVLKSEPIIQLYSNFKLKEQISLNDNKIIQSRISFINKEITRDINNNSKTYAIFFDAYLNNNFLFLLTIDNQNDKARSNKIVVFDLNNKAIVSVLILNETGLDDWFSRICVHKNILLAFNEITGHLCKFDLKKIIKN
ncbi:Hypothetical protein IALB_0684 [Ignavibacterium album JCM 16511]|uniref:6-bladed beta-propeller n=1 Tax=Ignavibacterium album (strain DSM 19864 / JCM 16511 / NBRC 101810 / Mat9-16) TaxID=945713 RepID=I0AHD9_IGNAJ|nr:6-bladed beta-propeller [Ignavibacterium album]AFH48396.1 Hypothetical protein IALB_0684 [Ignavibacterium album JCM 16511]